MQQQQQTLLREQGTACSWDSAGAIGLPFVAGVRTCNGWYSTTLLSYTLTFPTDVAQSSSGCFSILSTFTVHLLSNTAVVLKLRHQAGAGLQITVLPTAAADNCAQSKSRAYAVTAFQIKLADTDIIINHLQSA